VSPAGRVEPAILREDLLRAGHRVGPLELLSEGGSLVFKDERVVVRLGGEDPHEMLETLGRVAQLSAARAPVLAPIALEPVLTRYGAVTLWPLAYPSRDPIHDLARACRGLHLTMTQPTGRDRSRQRMRTQLRALGGVGVPEDVHRQLLDLAARLPEEPSWGGYGGLVHGDAHPGNVAVYDGAPVLIDLISLRNGPVELDFVPLWCAARRGRSHWSHWQRFQDGYGDLNTTRRLGDWEHLEEAVLERELTTTIFLAQRWLERPWVREEIALRLRSWDEPERGERWNTGL
jgi:hypothetical protein